MCLEGRGALTPRPSPNPVSASVLPGPQHPTLRARTPAFHPSRALFSTALREGPGGDRCPEGLCPRSLCPPCLRPGCPRGAEAGPPSQGPHLPTQGHLRSDWGGIPGAPAGSSVLMTVLPKRLGRSARGEREPALRAAAAPSAGGPRASGRGDRHLGWCLPPGSVLWGRGGSAPQALSGRQGEGWGSSVVTG